jgi:hypothetical protein
MGARTVRLWVYFVTLISVVNEARFISTVAGSETDEKCRMK